MEKLQKPIESAIHHAGGVTRLASAIGVTQSAISNWKARGTTPNAAFCFAIERATNGLVTRRDLRPQDWHLIWPELAGNEAFTPSFPAAELSGPLAGVQEGVGVRG